VFRSSLDGQLLSINLAGALMFKYDSSQEMIETANRTSVLEALYVDSNHWQAVLAATSSSDQWYVCEEQFYCKDGSIIDCNVHIRAVCDVEGRPVEMEGFYEDISERKKAERDLQLTQFIVEKSGDQAFWVTPEGHFRYVNQAACAALGYSREELEGMALWDIDPHVSPENAADLWRQVKESGLVRFERLHRSKDGRIYPVEICGNYVKFDGQEYSCAFVADITDRKRAEEALRESEARYRSIVEHAPFGITRSTRDGKLLSVNPALAAILKYDSAQELREAIDRSSIQEVLFPEPSEREPLVEQIFSSDSWNVFNNRLRCKDGSFVTCRVHSRRIVDKAGRTSAFESYQENISDQVAAEQALRESEEKFRVLTETSPVAISLYQGEHVTYANPAMARLFGYSAEELRRMKFWDWVHEDHKELVRSRASARLAGEAVSGQYEFKCLTKDGGELYILVSAGTMEHQGRTTGIASFLDITERKCTEELVQASLTEKEVLLKEIHHRVKNNLQVVSSLLFLQAQKFKDPELQNCFLESQSRICSMALAHEQLYQSKNLAEVSVRNYVQSLVEQLQQIFLCPEQKEIDCRLAVEEVDLDIQKVVPCGLLITELLSNAYKHAFVDGRSGQITISLQSSAGQIELAVADDGVGLPADFNHAQATTLGLQLVTALVNQLSGTLELETDVGTRFRICFAG
jgi:PAS domain S-box-containing protein